MTLATAEWPGGIELLPATAEDLEFLYQVYASSREEELSVVPWSAAEKAAFLRSQFNLQHQQYHQHFTEARFDLICRDGVPLGRLYVDRGETIVTIIDNALLTEHRGQGIGGRLIREILEEAGAAGKRVRLHVELNNPVRRLYARLGFQRIADHGVYYQMEWVPQPSPAE